MYLKKSIARTLVFSIVSSCVMTTSAFAGVIGVVTGDSINIRSANSTTANVIDTLSSGESINILSKSNDWYKISYGSVSTAYISDLFVKVTNVSGTINANDVNVRNNPSTNSDVVGKINKDDTVNIVGQYNDWYAIKRQNGDTAYISKSFVNGNLTDLVPAVNVSVSNTVSNTYAIVTANGGLKLRSTPSLSANVLSVLSNGDVVDVTESGSEWIKVKTDDGTSGYLSTQFVSIRKGEKPSRSIASSKGDQIIAYAKQFIGTPYVWGGTNLNKGVDCSGFVYSVMNHFGINLNRSSSSMASNGVPVSKDQLLTGDLVFFDTSGANNGAISHVGIYIGNGDYIHSSSGKAWGVTINNLSEDYSSRTYVTARRILR